MRISPSMLDGLIYVGAAAYVENDSMKYPFLNAQIAIRLIVFVSINTPSAMINMPLASLKYF